VSNYAGANSIDSSWPHLKSEVNKTHGFDDKILHFSNVPDVSFPTNNVQFVTGSYTCKMISLPAMSLRLLLCIRKICLYGYGLMVYAFDFFLDETNFVVIIIGFIILIIIPFLLIMFNLLPVHILVK
jgi:hypothetical protein